MQTKQTPISNTLEASTRIKRRNILGILGTLLIVGFFVLSYLSSSTKIHLIFYAAFASLFAGVALAICASCYNLDIIRDKIDRKAKEYIENLDMISGGKRIIGKNLKIVIENWKYTCETRAGHSHRIAEILARSQNERWVVIELECSRYHIEGYTYIADDDYAKQRLKHNRDLYVEYFGEPEIA